MTRLSSEDFFRPVPYRTTRLFMSALSLVWLVTGISGCATTPKTHEIKSVRVCAAGECSEAGQRYSASQLLFALGRFFQANDGAGLKFCNSSPDTHQCLDGDIGYFVLGGFVLPGRGSSSSGLVSKVKLDTENQSVRYVMAMYLRFLGLPLLCADHEAQLMVRSVHDISIKDKPYLCNWLVMGIMTASFSYEVDWIDFDKGQLGGYWKHSVTGTGNGRGQGYSLLVFPKSMPPDENWFAQK